MKLRAPIVAMTTLLIGAACALTPAASADDLTRLVQQDLQAQGYDPGAVDGEMTTQTAIAISQFQAAQGLAVTGEITPQLAGIVKAVGRGRYQPAPAAGAAVVPTTMAPPANPTLVAPPDPMAAAGAQTDLRARQQACLEEKVAAAKKRKKKKRGFGRLVSGASRVGRRFGLGGFDRIAYEVYDVNATAGDLAAAAKDLGLTEDEVEECRNPPAKEG